MKKFLIATALIAATAATASAESTVVQSQDRLDRAFAQLEEKQDFNRSAPTALERVLGRLNVNVISPVDAEQGVNRPVRTFTAGNRGR